MQHKSTKKWIILLILPYVLVVFIAITHFVATEATGGNPACVQAATNNLNTHSLNSGYSCAINPGPTALRVRNAVNMINLGVFLVAFLIFLLTPLWVLKLKKAKQYNRDLFSKTGSKRKKN
jgi:hypothetical protein